MFKKITVYLGEHITKTMYINTKLITEIEFNSYKSYYKLVMASGNSYYIDICTYEELIEVVC